MTTGHFKLRYPCASSSFKSITAASAHQSDVELNTNVQSLGRGFLIRRAYVTITRDRKFTTCTCNRFVVSWSTNRVKLITIESSRKVRTKKSTGFPNSAAMQRFRHTSESRLNCLKSSADRPDMTLSCSRRRASKRSRPVQQSRPQTARFTRDQGCGMQQHPQHRNPRDSTASASR
jgi:hypothetical protein